MRVLLICDAGDGLLDLALRAQAEHQVRMYIRKFDPRTRPIGKGLVELVDDWRKWMLWSDLVVLEGNGVYMAEMEVWRRRGCLIIGGDDKSAAWELDRNKGMSVFKKAGIAVPSFREFTDYETAIRFVEKSGEVFYSKPCSDTADKSLSAKTGVPEDPTYMLRKWKKKHGRPPCPFLLQQAIEGTEFAVGAWFGPAGFADGYEENHEFKKLFSGDVGPNCGEAGTVVRYVRRSKLAERVLVQLEEHLANLGYCGNIDVNCIIDDEGNPWPLEFTVRLGWPAFNIETALFNCDPIDFLHALASGESIRGAHRMNEVAVGVVMALPPYPNPPRDYDDIVGVPMWGADPEHWHPCECMSGPREVHLDQHQRDQASDRHAGNDLENDIQPFRHFSSAGGYLGVATGTGGTVRQAARGAYRVLDRISMPASPFWRNDIGARLKKELPKLQEHGFAAGMEF